MPDEYNGEAIRAAEEFGLVRQPDEFKCYQAAETVHVVLASADLSDHRAAPPAVVSISRAVGSPRARALMRLCNAVLNGDGLAAQRQLDQLHNVGEIT